MFEHHMSRLKGVLSKKEYEKAGYQLTDIIIRAYQKRVLKSRVWIYVAKISFDKTVTTAQVNLNTGFVVIGIDFFLKNLSEHRPNPGLLLPDKNPDVLILYNHQVESNHHYLHR